MGASGDGSHEHPLPEGAVAVEYLQVEYLHRTYIDTGIIPDASTVVQLKVMPLSVTGDIIIGYKSPSDATDWRLFNYQSHIYFDNYNNGRINGGTMSANNLYELELGNFYVKDIPTNTVLLSGRTYTGTGVGHIYIFGETAVQASYNRFYYVKIFSGPTKIMDLVPIRIGKVGMMFDKVSGNFFKGLNPNEDFIVGPDKT